MSTSGSPSSDIVAFIKANGKQVLGTRFWDIRKVCRVEAGFKTDKLEAKCLVISKFRLFLVSGRSVSKLQIDCNFHLLQISSVEIVTEIQLRLLLDGRSLHVSITEPLYSASALAKEILCAFKHYFPTCNVKRFIELVPTSLYLDYTCLSDRAPVLHCGCFRRTYAALCDFHKLTYWDEVVWDVEKIYASHETRTLRLEDFDHLAQKDIISILAVLEFNSWFTGLSLINASSNIKFTGELLEALLKVVRKNESLELLELANCGLRGDFLFALGNALLANPSLPLKSINLSKNTFEDHSKPITQFATSLTRLESSIVELDLSDCGIGTKSLNILARSFQAAGRIADSLRALRLRNNSLKDDLADFYQLLARCSCLVELDLSGSGVSLEKLCGALMYGGKDLAILKLSGCVFSHKKLKDVNIPNSLKNYFTTALALKTIDFSCCNLPAEVIKSIMLGLACNQTLGGVELNLSGTCVDKQVIQVLDTCLEKLSCVESLILRDNMFCDELTVILPALNKMPNLKTLDLGGNNFSNIRPKMLPNLLVELVKLMNDDEKNLQSLSLSDSHLGASLSIVINALGVSSRLNQLDISGNGIRDGGARMLAKSLQINTSLTTLSIDRNQISQHGFLDLCHALSHNFNVIELPYPVCDIAELLNSNSKEKEKVEGILQKIQASVFRNRKSRRTSSELDTSILAKSKITVINVEEILNKQVNNANRLLNDERTDQTSPDVKALRVLLDDAEKTKRVLHHVLESCDKGDAIRDSIHKNLEFVYVVVDELLKQNLETISSVAESEVITAGLKEDVKHSVREICEARCGVDNSSAVSSLLLTIKENYKTATCDMATAATERLMQEIIIQMDTLFKKINPDARGFGSSDLRSLSTTPKQKPKGLPFNRPISVVSSSLGDTRSDNNDLTVASSVSLDSVSLSSVEKENTTVDELSVSIAPVKLVHLQKGRPKRTKNVRVSAAVPEAFQESSNGFDLSETNSLTPTTKILKFVAEELEENRVSSKVNDLESPAQLSTNNSQTKVAMKPPIQTPSEISSTFTDRSPLPSPRRIDFDSKVPPNTPADILNSLSSTTPMAQASLHEPTNEEPNPFDPPISLAPLKVFRSEASPLHSPRSPAAARVQSTEEDYAEIELLSSPKLAAKSQVDESPVFHSVHTEVKVTMSPVVLPAVLTSAEPVADDPAALQEPFKEAVSLMSSAPKLRNPKLDANSIAAEINKKNYQPTAVSSGISASSSQDVARLKAESELNNNKSASRKSMFGSPDAAKPAVPSKPAVKEPFRSGLRPTHMSLGDTTSSPSGDVVIGGPPQRPKSIAELKTQFEAQQPPPRPPRKALNKIGPSEGS